VPLDDAQLAKLAEGIRLFNAGEYFAAHDAWEELWTGYRGPWRNLLKGLIQVAVALYHFERGNLVGARKLRRTSQAYLLPFAAESPLVNVADLLGSYPTMFAGLQEGVALEDAAVGAAGPIYDASLRPQLSLTASWKTRSDEPVES
jgi:hypothetical protein